MSDRFLEGKKIAVFGATSNIASHFLPAALERGAEVVAFARDEERLQHLKKLGVKIVTGDIRVIVL